jgi:hypothetical protein
MFLAGRLHQSGALVTSLRVVAVETGNPAYSRWADLAEKVIPEAEPILWSQKSPLLIDFPNWDTDPDQFRAAKAFLAPVVAEGFRSYLTAFLHSTKHNVTSMMRGEYLLGGYPRYGLDSPAGAAVLGLGYDAYRSSRLANRPLLTEEDAPTLFRLWRGLCWASTAWALVAWLALAALLFIRPSPAAGAAFVLLSSVYADLLACGTLSTLATRFLERVVALPAVALVLSLAAVLRRPTSS